MKLVVKKSSLEVCVKNLCKVINTNNALPILSDIVFEVNEQEKTARLTASDSEVWLNCDVILDECEGGGIFCINGSTLENMLAQIKEQPLTITATTESDMRFTMTYEDGQAYCAIVSADEYPTPIQHDTDKAICVSLDADILKRTIKRSLWTTTIDDLRPIMNGIEFDFNNGQLNVVASDGHSLIKNAEEIDFDYNSPADFIMPKNVAKILPAILGDDDDDCDVMFNDTLCTIEWEMTSLQFRCIEGKYPNYESIIPLNSTHNVNANRMFLINALKTVAPFATESSNMVTLTFFKDGKLILQGTDYDMAKGANKTIYVEGYEGEDEMTIGVKASKLITLLQKLSGAAVILSFTDPSRAILIRPEEESEPSETVTGLIMPMLVND